MPNSQQQPKTDEKAAQAAAVRYFTRDNPPPKPEKPKHEPIPVYDWIVKDNVLDIAITGYRDLHMDVQAAKGETLQEIIERQPGRNHMDKLRTAVNSGIIPMGMPPHDKPEDMQVNDLTGMPNDLLEAQKVLQKAKVAASRLPKDLVDENSRFDKIFDALGVDNVKAWLDKHTPKQEEAKSSNE